MISLHSHSVLFLVVARGRNLTRSAILLLAGLLLTLNAHAELAGKLLHLQLETTLVPSPASVDVLLPPGYDEQSEPIPLFIWLHGGSSGQGVLERQMKPYMEKAWASGALTPCVVVTPVTGSSYYMDWHDGSNQWDTFITQQLLSHMRKQYHVRQGRDGTVIGGASAGGQGTLRIALRHPELFVAAAAMEPGFPPVLKFDDWDISGFGPNILPVLHGRFGNPVDNAFWRGIHPPAMVIDHPQMLRDSGLQLLLEAGDEDANGTFRSAELLHRLLYDAAIEHDYHLHRGAAHTGRSMDWRMPEAFSFLSRALNPPEGPDKLAVRHKQGAVRKGRYEPRTTNELPLTPVIFDKPKS
jgi:S-formylglutathione hydrolase